jgi:hypothetical protein
MGPRPHGSTWSVGQNTSRSDWVDIEPLALRAKERLEYHLLCDASARRAAR